MSGKVRISLANKCQLLFGAAVILTLTAALSVVWWQLDSLVSNLPRKRARDFAAAWLEDRLQLGLALSGANAIEDRPQPGGGLTLALLNIEEAHARAAVDGFVREAMTRFEESPQEDEWFEEIRREEDEPLFRFALAVRESEAMRLRGFRSRVDMTSLVNPVELVLLIQLHDPDVQRLRALNLIYVIAAGVVAALVAIGVFWFITTRIILSPVRVLRDTAAKISEGDLNIRAEVNTGDEFEELSNMFNHMLETLKTNQEELRGINKSLDLKLGELAETNVALYEANKIKGDFLANVSHELRTPLNSIVGFAEVLSESFAEGHGERAEKGRRYIANIITSSKRLLELINDLLDLAKIEAGRMELRVGPMSLADTVEGLVNLIRPQAEKRSIRVEHKVSPRIPLIQTDAGKFQQILFNFLSNAAKFTPDGGEIKVSATLDESSPNREPRVRVSVSDTGPGIPPRLHERVFEKFTQLDATETKVHGGSGLGLTISRELAEMLRGRIELDSDVGRGATFTLVIPLTVEERSIALMPDLTEGGVSSAAP